MSNQLSNITWQALTKKGIIWGIWLFLLALLQTSFFSVLRPFGAVPSTVLPAVIAIAVYDRERMGTVAGITGGFLADALGGVDISLSPVIYMLCGCLAALLVYSIFGRGFFAWLVFTLASLVISVFFEGLGVFASVPGFTFFDALSEILMPCLLSSLSVGIPIYFLTKLIWSLLFDNREMEG